MTEKRYAREQDSFIDSVKIHMSNPLSKVKPAVLNIAPYTLKPHSVGIKLNQNENPFDMPLEIKDEVMRRIANRPWSRYPTFDPTDLLEKLAAFLGWRADGVL